MDARTGHVDILDYIAIEDVGVAINPHIVHGQAIGALVQGLGGVFLDQIMYDHDAQMLNASLADYLVPLATDFSNVRAITMELRRSRTNPLGAKGAGEGGMVAVAATMANAVAAALAPLGVEVRDLPLSPARLWNLVNSGGVAAQITDVVRTAAVWDLKGDANVSRRGCLRRRAHAAPRSDEALP